MVFWEQYSHEPYIAVCRFCMLYEGKSKTSRESWRVERGERALDSLEQRLSLVQWLAADSFMVADSALVACTRVAAEGGFDLSGRRGVCRWIRDGELELGLAG